MEKRLLGVVWSVFSRRLCAFVSISEERLVILVHLLLVQIRAGTLAVDIVFPLLTPFLGPIALGRNARC